MKKLKFSIRGKFILLFGALALLLAAGISVAAYSLNKAQIETQYANLAMNSANMAGTLIDAVSIERYMNNGQDDSYRASYIALQELKRAYGLKYLYVLVPDTTQNDAVYIFDIPIEGDDNSLIMELGTQAGAFDVYDTVLTVFTTGRVAEKAQITTGEYGYLASAYAPLIGPDGKTAAVIGVDISMNVIMDQIITHTVQIVIIAVAIILGFMLVTLIVVNRSIIRPIKALSAHMEHFVDDEQSAVFSEITSIRTRDELSTMAGSFNQMAGDIRRYTENLAAVTADRERIATELNVATQIQASMLPSIFPPFPDRREFRIFASMAPAKEVGGDFYDFFMLDERRLAVVIADVSGKGVPAALFMVIAKTLIKNQASVSAIPAEIFGTVNDQLCENNDANLFVTAFMGILELDTGKFTYANAGHNPPLISRAGRRYEWLNVEPGLMLAGWEGFAYGTASMTLRPGDRLFLYTDGVTEALNSAEELYGDDQLHKALGLPGVPAMRPEQVIGYIKREVDAFAGMAEQADDITMLSLSFDSYMEREQNE